MPSGFGDITPAELGELYYQYTDPDATFESLGLSSIEGMTPEAFFWEQVHGFQPEYYQYMPQDYEYGPYMLNMLDRSYDLDVDDLNIDSITERKGLDQSYGMTGFSGSGGRNQQVNDLWSQYQLQTAGLLSDLEDSKRSVYEAQGTAIYRMLEDLALTDIGDV